MKSLTVADLLVLGGAFTAGAGEVQVPRIDKKGTFDIFVVEANPIVFKGKLWRMEHIRDFGNGQHHRGNQTGS